MNQYKKEALEYIKEIRNELKDGVYDKSDFIDFKLETLELIIKDI